METQASFSGVKHFYRPLAGSDITSFAKCTCDFSRMVNEEICISFNGVKIVIEPDDDSETIVNRYRSEMNRRSQEYLNSPKGKSASHKIEERKQRDRSRVGKAMSMLDDLNFLSMDEIIKWLKRIQNASWRIGLHEESKKIVREFERHGFKPNVNCGKRFKGDDEENFARYIIGQVLDCLNSFANIPSTFKDHIEDWQKKFGYAT